MKIHEAAFEDDGCTHREAGGKKVTDAQGSK